MGADANHDIPIFTLSVLLSSTFIFNNKGTLDEGSLDSLSVIAKLAEKVAVRAGNKTSSKDTLSSVFPQFVAVLRDFHLNLMNEGSEITSDEYLEQALNEMPGGESGRNSVRKVLREAFLDRKCFPLPFPATGALSNLKLSRCAPCFREAMGGLTTHLHAHTPIKSFGQRAVTGSVLLGMLEAWVNAINGGAVPNIYTTLERVIDTIHASATASSLAAYDQGMADASKTCGNEFELMQWHNKAKAAAEMVLSRHSTGDVIEDPNPNPDANPNTNPILR